MAHGEQEHDEQQLDLVDKIMRYESGDMGEDETTEFFQYLVDSGLAWELQGSYGRQARSLIDVGILREAGE